MSAVDIKNLEKSYGDTSVLERINLNIESGSFCTIVGASGCGKSTFLRILLSQEVPTRGSILVDGEPLALEPTPDRGIVFQRYSVFPQLCVEDNLILTQEFSQAPLTGRLFGAARKAAREQVAETLENIGLMQAKDRYPSQLSGGMQQRLAIAQSLLMEPKILLLDEPFGALDPGIRADMHILLLSLWREKKMTVFMVTHDIHEAFKLGTRLLVFDKVRHDAENPDAYGATITYDLALSETMDDAPSPETNDIIHSLQETKTHA